MAACDVYLNYPDRFSSEMAGTQRGYGTPSFHEEMMFTPIRHGSKSVGGSSSDLSASSRKSEMLQEYFKSTSALNRSIMTEKTLVEKEHMHWSVLSESRRDEIVDQHFVPEDVRLQYEGSLMEGPTYAWSNRLQKTSNYTQSQSTLDDWDTSESVDGVVRYHNTNNTYILYTWHMHVHACQSVVACSYQQTQYLPAIRTGSLAWQHH